MKNSGHLLLCQSVHLAIEPDVWSFRLIQRHPNRPSQLFMHQPSGNIFGNSEAVEPIHLQFIKTHDSTWPQAVGLQGMSRFPFSALCTSSCKREHLPICERVHSLSFLFLILSSVCLDVLQHQGKYTILWIV